MMKLDNTKIVKLHLNNIGQYLGPEIKLTLEVAEQGVPLEGEAGWIEITEECVLDSAGLPKLGKDAMLEKVPVKIPRFSEASRDCYIEVADNIQQYRILNNCTACDEYGGFISDSGIFTGDPYRK